MAGPEGLEPSTCRLEVGCSIQLSYGPALPASLRQMLRACKGQAGATCGPGPRSQIARVMKTLIGSGR